MPGINIVRKPLWLILAVVCIVLPDTASYAANNGVPQGTPSCLGHITSLEVFEEHLFIGTPGGLFFINGPDAGRVLRVEGVERAPVKELFRDGDTLVLVFGNLKSIGLTGWQPEHKRFGSVLDIRTKQENRHLIYHEGFIVSGDIQLEGERFIGTVGGGLFHDGGEVKELPEHIIALKVWKSGIAATSPDGLYYWSKPGGWNTLFRNAARDCRITSFTAWKGEVYAGTLSGGVVRLPGYDEVGDMKGLAARINGIASSADMLFIATEAGLYTWDGEELNLLEGSGEESVKSLQVAEDRIFYSTPTGLYLYYLDKGSATRLSLRRGAIMQLLDGDIYVGGMYGAWRISISNGITAERILHDYVTGFATYGQSLLISTYYNGLWSVSESGAKKMIEGNYTAVRTSDRFILLGTGSEGIIVFDPQQGNKKRLTNISLPAENITALWSLGDMIYIGTPAGFSHFPRGEPGLSILPSSETP